MSQHTNSRSPTVITLHDFKSHTEDCTLENWLTHKMMIRHELKLLAKTFISPFTSRRQRNYNSLEQSLKFVKPVDVTFSPQFQCLIVVDENGIHFINHKNGNL